LRAMGSCSVLDWPWQRGSTSGDGGKSYRHGYDPWRSLSDDDADNDSDDLLRKRSTNCRRMVYSYTDEMPLSPDNRVREY